MNIFVDKPNQPLPVGTTWILKNKTFVHVRPTAIILDEGSIRPPIIVAYRPLSFPVKCG